MLSVFLLFHPLYPLHYLHYFQVCYIIHPSQMRSSSSLSYKQSSLASLFHCQILGLKFLYTLSFKKCSIAF
jgi:hypothetical protein